MKRGSMGTRDDHLARTLGLAMVIIFYISPTEPQISLGLRLHFIHLVSSRLHLAQCPATNKCLINVYRMKGLQK